MTEKSLLIIITNCQIEPDKRREELTEEHFSTLLVIGGDNIIYQDWSVHKKR